MVICTHVQDKKFKWDSMCLRRILHKLLKTSKLPVKYKHNINVKFLITDDFCIGIPDIYQTSLYYKVDIELKTDKFKHFDFLSNIVLNIKNDVIPIHHF